MLERVFCVVCVVAGRLGPVERVSKANPVGCSERPRTPTRVGCSSGLVVSPSIARGYPKWMGFENDVESWVSRRIPAAGPGFRARAEPAGAVPEAFSVLDTMTGPR